MDFTQEFQLAWDVVATIRTSTNRNSIMKWMSILCTAALGAAALTLSGCGDDEYEAPAVNQSELERDLNQGMNEAERGLQEAQRGLQDATNEAGQNLREATNEAGQQMEQAGENIQNRAQ